MDLCIKVASETVMESELIRSQRNRPMTYGRREWMKGKRFDT